MDEAQKYYGMANMNMPIKYTFVLNTKNPLCEKINLMADGENKDKAINYVYTLAKLSGGAITPEELSQFVKNSAQILEESL